MTSGVAFKLHSSLWIVVRCSLTLFFWKYASVAVHFMLHICPFFIEFLAILTPCVFRPLLFCWRLARVHGELCASTCCCCLARVHGDTIGALCIYSLPHCGYAHLRCLLFVLAPCAAFKGPPVCFFTLHWCCLPFCHALCVILLLISFVLLSSSPSRMGKLCFSVRAFILTALYISVAVAYSCGAPAYRK